MLITFKWGDKEYINYDLSDDNVKQRLIAEGIDLQEVVKNFLIEKLNRETDRYFYAEAKARGGYLNMGEIEHDAAQGDPDAQFLRQLYDAVWAKEEELEAELSQMTLQQLLELDLESWARSAYDQVKANLETQSGGTA